MQWSFHFLGKLYCAPEVYLFFQLEIEAIVTHLYVQQYTFNGLRCL